MLFYFFYVQIFLITVEQFFNIFTQKYFQNVIYLKLPISECISPVNRRFPPICVSFWLFWYLLDDCQITASALLPFTGLLQ